VRQEHDPKEVAHSYIDVVRHIARPVFTIAVPGLMKEPVSLKGVVKQFLLAISKGYVLGLLCFSCHLPPPSTY